jgi:hypothetical protein
MTDQIEIDSVHEARDQADEYEGFARSGRVKAHKTGKWYTVTNLLMLDDDQQDRYDALIHELNQCDKYPDVEIPEQVVPERHIKVTDPDGSVSETTVAEHRVPARVQRGDFIEPYQKDGVRITPPYNVAIAQIVLDDYEGFKAGGGRSSEVRMELLRMKKETEERQRNDSKSGDGVSPVEGVPAGD